VAPLKHGAVRTMLCTIGRARRGLTRVLAPMRVIGQLLLVVVLGAATGSAVACIPEPPTEALAIEAEAVSAGIIQSTSLVKRPVGAPVVGLASTNSRSLAMPELIAKVNVSDRMLGNDPGTVDAVLPCVLPLQAGERVIVATLRGRRVAFPADMYEEVFRSVYGQGRR
jgi:hypothetical protein